MAKYDPLKNYLGGLPDPQNEVFLSFKELERILGAELPPAAYKHRPWWANQKNGGHVNAKAWMEAGWKVDAVNQREHWVRFIRQSHVFPKSHSESVDASTPKVTMFSANKPNKTLAIHKPGCPKIPTQSLRVCGCGDTGELGNQRWWCERHITLDQVDKFMNGRHWAIILCDVCFKE